MHGISTTTSTDRWKLPKFLYRIGVDGIDLKFCHGYLGSQLLRPYNDRDWKYGGSWENRSRFAFETCERIRRAVPDPKFLIGARVSMYEEMPGGQGHAGADSFCYDLSESIALLQGLEARGCSYFGGNHRKRFRLLGEHGPFSILLHECVSAT